MAKNPNYLISNLLYLMGKQHLNANSLAERVGNTPPQATIFRILNGESKTPRDETLAPLAELFSVPIHALRYSDLASGVNFSGVLYDEAHPRLPKARKVPILRPNESGQLGPIRNEEGKLTAVPDGHAIIATDDDLAFVVPVLDDLMSPRFMQGEYALVEPSTEPEIEDDVLVCLADGRVFLRRLLSRRGGVKLGNYKNSDSITYSDDQISWVYWVPNSISPRKTTRKST